MIGFPVNETIQKRYSVRTYTTASVEDALKEKIMNYAAELQNPFGPKVQFRFIEKKTAENGEKLGTYGTIHGADLFIGSAIANDPCAAEAIGYEFEQLILYITSLGLGTCWLGGTFNRSAFAAAMELEDGMIFPAISPVGYPAEKKRIPEKLMRRTVKADERLPGTKLFFKTDFKTPLSKTEAGAYRYPLQMLRLAPSAVNKQPWRVVYDGKAFHFFEKHTLKEAGPMDMQRIDLGIALCHFHLAAQEWNLKGTFEKQELTFKIPKDMTYITSWIIESNS